MTTTQTVHLQGIGLVRAIPAEQLQVGTRMVWNYGYVSEVVAIEPKGKLSLSVTERSERSGELFTRTFRKTRLVGVTK